MSSNTSNLEDTVVSPINSPLTTNRTIYLANELREAEFKFLRTFAQEAILDPNEDVRKNAVEHIIDKTMGQYIIKGGFPEQGKVFLVVTNSDGIRKRCYVSDIPEEYKGYAVHKFGESF